jgi:hypothetical protein
MEGSLGQNTPSYFSKNDFWKQLGCNRHPELDFQIFWTNIDEAQESAHKAVLLDEEFEGGVSDLLLECYKLEKSIAYLFLGGLDP